MLEVFLTFISTISTCIMMFVNNWVLIILGDVSDSNFVAKENHLDVNSCNNLMQDSGGLLVLCRASASPLALDSTIPRAYESIPNRNIQNVKHAVVNEDVQLKEIKNLTEAVGEISMLLFFIFM